MPDKRAKDESSIGSDSPLPSAAPDRRAFLKAGAALSAAAGGMLVPAAAQSVEPLAVPPGMKEQGNPIVSPPYGVPSPFEKNVVRRFRDVRVTNTAATSFAPLQDMHGIITPNGLCFERHHGGVPQIDPGQHRLVLHGLVERPLIFTMDELMRFPSVSRIHFSSALATRRAGRASGPSSAHNRRTGC